MISFSQEIPFTLPLLISKSLVCFPGNERKLFVEREFSKNALIESKDNHENYALFTCQKDVALEDIDSLDDIYDVGVLCRINVYGRVKGAIKVTVAPLERVKITNLEKKDGCFFATAQIFQDVLSNDIQREEILIVKIGDELKEVDPNFFPVLKDKAFKEKMASGIQTDELGYLISDGLEINVIQKQKLLEASDTNERLLLLLEDFESIKRMIEIERDIQTTVANNNQEASKEYYLREKIKAIKNLLGEGNFEDANSLLLKCEEGDYPEEVKQKVREELRKYDTLPNSTPESGLILDYVKTVLDLPWSKSSIDNDDIFHAEEVLNRDHYGLEKVKKRILEYLAVKKAKGNLKAPILCLYGPPGCGKTSICKSIAESLNRKFIKTSFGGVSDEAEIRGHRRTYVASRPGRIIQLIKKCGTNNPLFLLDEIDKIGRDSFKGDPTAALMEVLDPVQNIAFNDNYLEVPFDLSNVLFICTANYIENIPTALRDRLELIEVESYTLLEKTQIALKYLIKKELIENGLEDLNISFTDESIKFIIEHYTREAGVRDLERKISSIIRKLVVESVKGIDIKDKIIDIDEVKKYLGIEVFDSTSKEKGSQVGVVTGLAYTQFGGDILPIEVNYFKGKGNLILTGQLGDVMKESCSIALDYVKSNASKYGIEPSLYMENDIHIHVPEGAVPKDGPSAGCAITTAIVSALTGRPVSGNIAMTGEVTLRGNALAIGGLKEKSLAALRSGIKTIIIPKDNKKAADELPSEVKNTLNIVFITNVEEAINYCLEK